MELAGISLFEDGRFAPDLLIDGRENPVEIVWRSLGGSEDFDPVAYLISANIHRRHLHFTREQKRGLVAELLKIKTELSDRSLARVAKVSPTTVGTIRAALEKTGDVSKLDTRTDAAGRQQPARKLSSFAREIGQDQLHAFRAEAAKESDPAPTLEQVADRKDVLRIIEDAIHLLSQRRSEIMALPIAARTGRAMALLDALGVGLDILVPRGRR